MKYLLISGAPSVGKSESIYRLANCLLRKGFIDSLSLIPSTFADFCAVLDGVDQTGKPIRIIINTATDTPAIIENFKRFYDANTNHDILISSLRDYDFWPRAEFFNIMGINPASPDLTELPLARITRRGANFPVALTWYYDQIDKLAQHVIENPPFNL